MQYQHNKTRRQLNEVIKTVINMFVNNNTTSYADVNTDQFWDCID